MPKSKRNLDVMTKMEKSNVTVASLVKKLNEQDPYAFLSFDIKLPNGQFFTTDVQPKVITTEANNVRIILDSDDYSTLMSDNKRLSLSTCCTLGFKLTYMQDV